jgi:hypothetical protein
MRLYNINGKLQSRNVSKYLIKWEGKSRSLIQKEVKKFLKTYWENQVVYEEFPVYGTRMKVDILNATKKIAVEVNGPQHSSFNKFFHNNSRMNYLESIKRDYQKREWLEKNNFKIIEVEEKDIKKLSPEFIENTFGISII